jgi:hypothetical protein
MKRPKSLSVAAMATVLIVAALAASVSQADILSYNADLSGETVPNASPGTGFTLVDYDDTAHTLRVQVTFSDLLGTTTVAHIHSPTAVAFTGNAGVATQTPTFSGFPAGVTSGSYDQTFDLTLASSFNAAFVTANGGTPAGAEAALTSSFADGKAYLNLHTSEFGGGEIRGFLQPVPEPSAFVLLGAGAVGLLSVGWRRRRPRE